MPDDEFQKRAARRRATLRGGVAHSFAELEEVSLEFWANAEPSVKLQAMWDAIVESWIIKGKRGPPPRLQGSIFGVGRFEL